MSRSLTPGLQLRERTVVRRRRDLPILGRITVDIGAQVTADTVVAKAELPGDLHIVRVSDQLGVDPGSVSKHLKVQIGHVVRKGDQLAQMSSLWGLFQVDATSPTHGTVEYFSEATGHVGIRTPAKQLELKAYLAGAVVEIVPGRSVVVESDATFVQGIFGVGGESGGVLHHLRIPSDRSVNCEHLPEHLEGKVVWGGFRPSIEALRLAAERGATGFITGSIDDAVLKEYVGYDIGVAVTGDENVPMVLILTEGFGSLPMGERVSQLLLKSEGRVCSINGATQVRAGAVRPEIIVSYADGGVKPIGEPLGGAALSVGARVRVIRAPYFGLLGEVQELPSELRSLESGTEARVCLVRLADGRSVTVPRANVEIFS